MQDELDWMRRRDFLRLSATTAAVAGLDAFLPQKHAGAQSQDQPAGTRNAPLHPHVLRSSQLEVTLDGDDGLPYEYRWTATGAKLRGEDFGLKMTATICKKKAWRFFTATVDGAETPSGFHASSARFRFTLRDPAAQGANAWASFTLHYELSDASLRIRLDEIKEADGYELIDVAMPRLVTVREEDGAAWLVHGDSGGHQPGRAVSFADCHQTRHGDVD